MRVRKISKTEIGRNLISIKKAEVEEFNSFVTAYKTNKASPRQVTGDDTVVGYYIGKNYPLGITP